MVVDENSYYADASATFGDRLSAAREQSGLNTKELAKSLGVKHSTLVAWENDLADPRANRLSTLAGMLNVSVGWLLTGQGEGVGNPEDLEQSLPADVDALLREIRAAQLEIKRQSDRLMLAEKRLRAVLKSEGV